MKKIIFLTSILLSGCANYGWIPPQGKLERDIAFETQYCQDSSLRKYPKFIVTKMSEPARLIPPREECRNIKRDEAYDCQKVDGKLVCKTKPIVVRDCRWFPSRMIEAQYVQVDENEEERKTDLALCMKSRGYVWGEIK